MFELLFPSYCINCNKPGAYLCMKCQKKLKPSLPECYVCRRISNNYSTHPGCNAHRIDSAFIGWQYDSVAKKILSQYKYRYAYKLSTILSSLLLERLKRTGFIKNIKKNSIIVPVPIHSSHNKERGFNQSFLIARQLSEHLGCHLDENLLVRVGKNQYQSQSSLRDRKILDQVFRLEKQIENQDLIILDDVITTGTTINRIAQTLENNSIKAIALFRGRPHYLQQEP